MACTCTQASTSGLQVGTSALSIGHSNGGRLPDLSTSTTCSRPTPRNGWSRVATKNTRRPKEKTSALAFGRRPCSERTSGAIQASVPPSGSESCVSSRARPKSSSLGRTPWTAFSTNTLLLFKSPWTTAGERVWRYHRAQHTPLITWYRAAAFGPGSQYMKESMSSPSTHSRMRASRRSSLSTTAPCKLTRFGWRLRRSTRSSLPKAGSFRACSSANAPRGSFTATWVP
mmetsp:Transcript_89058/g.247444  ORF Transcript_89058/g.247444 Transcript_89058/m.247444 type:complete len:229 (-) Transcript_89058:1372-2058(-)